MQGSPLSKKTERCQTLDSTQSACSVSSSPAHRSHGTEVASLLVSRTYGMVPDAALLAYQNIDDTSAAGIDCPMKAGVLPTEVSSLINKAINDGASIINYSATSPSPSEYLKWAIARAMSQGVIITTGAGNTSSDNTGSSLSQWSGVVGVSAIGTEKVRLLFLLGAGSHHGCCRGPRHCAGCRRQNLFHSGHLFFGSYCRGHSRAGACQVAQRDIESASPASRQHCEHT